jgi:hypothetical protein
VAWQTLEHTDDAGLGGNHSTFSEFKFLLREKSGKYYFSHGEQEVFYDQGNSRDSVVFFPHFLFLHILTVDTVEVLSH